MSRTVFSTVLLLTLVLSFWLLSNRVFIMLKETYPNLDRGIAASIVAFACIAVALAVSFLVLLLYRWLFRA